jgi:hypothetical protein
MLLFCLVLVQGHAVPFHRGFIEWDIVHDEKKTERKIQAGENRKIPFGEGSIRTKRFLNLYRKRYLRRLNCESKTTFIQYRRGRSL